MDVMQGDMPEFCKNPPELFKAQNGKFPNLANSALGLIALFFEA